MHHFLNKNKNILIKMPLQSFDTHLILTHKNFVCQNSLLSIMLYFIVSHTRCPQNKFLRIPLNLVEWYPPPPSSNSSKPTNNATINKSTINATKAKRNEICGHLVNDNKMWEISCCIK